MKDYFILNPDFTILKKYITFPQSTIPLQEVYKDGYPIVMDYYYEEKVQECEDGFRDLLRKYSLLKHYDNLMVLCLMNLQVYESNLYEFELLNDQRECLKQLSQVLLLYKEKQGDDELTSRFKSKPRSFTVTNQNLMRYIGRVLVEGIESGNYGLGELGFDLSVILDKADGKFELSIDKLRELEKLPIIDLRKLEKKLIAELCLLYIIPYLQNETEHRKTEGTMFADLQLTITYDILIFFGLFKDRHFDHKMDYDPKDFMRNYLMKYLRTLPKRETKNKKN